MSRPEVKFTVRTVLVACLACCSQAYWCVQLDVQGMFKDVADRKPLTQQEMRDVINPVATTMRLVLGFTCTWVTVDLGRVRYKRSDSDVFVTGSLLFTPLISDEDKIEYYRQCVKTANILKPLDSDGKYFGKLRKKYTASLFLSSAFRDYCGPPIPVPPPDFSTAIDHKLVAILIFAFLFFEMLVALFIYLKNAKTSASASATRAGRVAKLPAQPRNLPGPSSSQVTEAVPKTSATSEKFASIFNRKKPNVYQDVEPSNLAGPSSSRATEETPKTSVIGGKLASVFSRKKPNVYQFSDAITNESAQ